MRGAVSFKPLFLPPSPVGAQAPTKEVGAHEVRPAVQAPPGVLSGKGEGVV